MRRTPRTTAVLLALSLGLPAPPAHQQSQVSTGASTLEVELLSPIRMHLDSKGVLLVADYFGSKIHVLGKAGPSAPAAIEIEGRPLSVAAGLGRVFVGNETRERVEVYTKHGKLLYDLGAGQSFKKPTDITIDELRQLVFVVDGTTALVRIFDLTQDRRGIQIGTIPQAGPDPLLLTHPTGIALDRAKGEVLISDPGDVALSVDPSVRIFDYKGLPIGSISGKESWMSSRFVRPQGLLIDKGLIYLTASYLGTVLILDRASGVQVGSVGTFGTGPGQLSLPLDVELDPLTRDLYVSSYKTKKIEFFEKGAKP